MSFTSANSAKVSLDDFKSIMENVVEDGTTVLKNFANACLDEIFERGHIPIAAS